jgi:hypothetical protein
MEETITLYISNMTKSVNLVIKCNRLITILDLKELVAKELDTYPCLFRLTNGTNLEEDLDALLTDLNIHNEDKLYFMNKLNVQRAVLEEWFRLDGHNWSYHDNWCSDLPLNEWFGIIRVEDGSIFHIQLDYNCINIIPKEISKLQNLVLLELPCNNIKIVPEELAKLSHLAHLNLIDNNISVLPPSVCKLNKLTEVYMDDNNLSMTPELAELAQRLTMKDNFLDSLCI